MVIFLGGGLERSLKWSTPIPYPSVKLLMVLSVIVISEGPFSIPMPPLLVSDTVLFLKIIF